MTTHRDILASATRRLPLLALLLGATVGLTPAPAQALGSTSTPPPDTIYACYVPGSGALYVIKTTDPTETCKSANHIQLQWEVTGPMGPQGPQGPQGPIGPQGPAGPVGAQGPAGPAGSPGPQGAQGPVGPQGPAGPGGFAGIEVVQASVDTNGLQTEETVVAQCPAGKKVIGGGVGMSDPLGNVGSSRPSADNTAWVVHVNRLGLNAVGISSYAICAVWVP